MKKKIPPGFQTKVLQILSFQHYKQNPPCPKAEENLKDYSCRKGKKEVYVSETY